MRDSGGEVHRRHADLRDTRSRTGSSSSSAFSAPMLQHQAIRWWDGDQIRPQGVAEQQHGLILQDALVSERLEQASGLSLEGRRSHEEHVLRILAENDMLRSTITAYSAMETKDTRLTAALETTKQLLFRAEQREERLVQIYDSVLDTFARAWWKRSRSRWLYQWAWGAIIGGKALGWRRFRVGVGRTFLHFSFSQWRDIHRKEMRQGGKILRALVRRDLQYMSRFLSAWTQESIIRRKLMRFGYLRTFRHIFNAFHFSVVKSRRMRRAAQHISHKSVYGTGRRVLREWARVHDREMKEAWRRHCTAAREALRGAMQPSAYKEFLLRAVSTHGPSPFDRSADLDLSALLHLKSNSASSYPGGGVVVPSIARGAPPVADAASQTLPLPPSTVPAPTIAVSAPRVGGEVREAGMMTDPVAASLDKALPMEVATPRGCSASTDGGGGARGFSRSPVGSDAWSSDGEGHEAALYPRGLAPSRGSDRARMVEGRGRVPGDGMWVPAGGAWRAWERENGGDGMGSVGVQSVDGGWRAQRGRGSLSGSASPPTGRRGGTETDDGHALSGAEGWRSETSLTRAGSGAEASWAWPGGAGVSGAWAVAGSEFERAGPPVADGKHSDRQSLRMLWMEVGGAEEYELRYRFRHEARQTWGGWLSVASGIQGTSRVVPVREDAVYCFQCRAKVRGEWAAWSAPSEVARAGGRRARRASMDKRGVSSEGLSREESEGEESWERGRAGEAGQERDVEGGASWAARMARARFQKKRGVREAEHAGPAAKTRGEDAEGLAGARTPTGVGAGAYEEAGRGRGVQLKRREVAEARVGESPDVSAVEIADATVVGEAIEPQTPPGFDRSVPARERMMVGAGIVVDSAWPFRVTGISKGRDGERAGRMVRVGDEVVAVDGVELGEGRADVMALLLGPRGTVVTCGIRRRGRGEQGTTIETVVLARD